MKRFLILFLLVGCAHTNWVAPDNFQYVPIKTGTYEIVTWQKITNPKNNHIHIYIEGDGYAFNSYGQPTDNPTPRGAFVRNLAMGDDFENVAYVARPCQFIMDANCGETDWTTGRFSQKIIDAERDVIKQIAKNKYITMIGYSGGAMISGLIIQQNPKMNFEHWVTIAGVLNHKQWTEFFGDMPLNESVDMEKLPNINQRHFFGGRDRVVPYDLAKQWANEKDITIVPNATHDDFGELKLFD